MTAEKKSGFLKQGLVGLQRRWQALAGSDPDEDASGFHPDLPPRDQPRLLECMRRALETAGGEISARAQAATLGRIYLALNPTGRGRFLKLLAEEFDLEEEALLEAAEELKRARGRRGKREARLRLREALVSPRTRILTRFNALPEGVKFLVDLRADLLSLTSADPALASLDDDLKALLTAWFDVDFLELRRISWNTASGALLEKFMAYEAVHPVESWEDLKNRLDYDRRYFAFFHPRMPDEPLIFLEVALTEELSGSIQELLDPESPQLDPDLADTAIFYSISNAQRGLSGVSFGGFLIKKVVDQLSRDFPDLRTFATLSPMPGFRSWLGEYLDGPGAQLLPQEEKRLREALEETGPAKKLPAKPLALDWVDRWRESAGLERAIRPVLMRWAAHYLLNERRAEGGALDPVAHFHLSNGAQIERLNWAGDLSERGLRQSVGIMVNYRYDLRKIELNHERYRGEGGVAATGKVGALLKG